MTLSVVGMSCGGCVKGVTRALEAAGFQDVVVNLEAGTATMAGDDRAAAVAAIEDAGFDVEA
jgi:copper chaperone